MDLAFAGSSTGGEPSFVQKQTCQPIRGEVKIMQVENIVVLTLKAAASVIEEVIGKK